MDIVVTGLGVVCPTGNNVEDAWRRVIQAESGIGEITRFPTQDMQVTHAAEVKDFQATPWLSPKDAKKTSRFIQYAVVSAGQALQQAGIDMEKDHLRIGTCIGVGIGALEILEDSSVVMHNKGDRRVSPFLIPYTICNMASGFVSQQFNLQGPSFSINSACASGTHSIGEAARMIQQGVVDGMIAGGAEGALSRLGIVGFDNMRALSRRNSSSASRPFDAEHDGFVFGEGAGVLFLENEETARKRGAKILARLSGYGSSADAWHITSPPPDARGAVASMKMAMQKVAKIDYINAHGTSTPTNDVVESRAILNALGEKTAMQTPISSTKSVTGHCLGAAGGIEAVLCIKALQDGIIPPTAHLDNPAQDCPLDYVPNIAREQKLQHVMSNSFGFGGTNASLVFSAV